MRRYHITIGATTTVGGTVISASSAMSIHGRTMALEGDQIICPACRSTGKIVCVGPRLPETFCGKNVALEDDLCQCGCPHPPKLKADQRSRCQELDSASPSPATSGQETGTSTETRNSCLFDEQIQFVLERTSPIANTFYRLRLEDGRVAEGTTDERGRTARLITEEPVRVLTAELYVPVSRSLCCAPPPREEEYVGMSFHLTATATNSNDVGSSVAIVSVKPVSRPLTPGEIQMARTIFFDAIDYSRVKVHGTGYFWFDLQSKNTAVTPNGEIYFNEEDFKADFSKEDARSMQWFMHEMVHVWQYQLGYPVKSRGAIRLGLTYKYDLRPGTSLRDYDMEAQGDLLADYFVLTALNMPAAMAQDKYRYSAKLYSEVLSDFFMDRSSKNNLPGGAPREYRRGDYDN